MQRGREADDADHQRGARAGAQRPQGEPAQTATGRNPPRWRKFVNLASALGVAFTDNPTLNGFGQQQLDERGGKGGFLSNTDNAYVSALIHRGFGQVVVARFRAPRSPTRAAGAARHARRRPALLVGLPERPDDAALRRLHATTTARSSAPTGS